MALKAVVFDIGETLIDETGLWERAADAAGVPRFTLMGVLGGLAARGPRGLHVGAAGTGMTAVHIRRGPWGHLHDPPPEAIAIRTLDELPETLNV